VSLRVPAMLRCLRRSLCTTPEDAASRNTALRYQLAVVYRTLERLNLSEGICNHLSVLAPARSGHGQVMLLAPLEQGFGEVTPDSLLGISPEGEVVEGSSTPEVSAFSIHLGLRQSRPGAQTNCLIHTHMPYATTLACLKDPRLRMVHQNSLRFHNRVSYDTEYAGTATALQEGQRLGRQLGDGGVDRPPPGGDVRGTVLPPGSPHAAGAALCGPTSGLRDEATGEERRLHVNSCF